MHKRVREIRVQQGMKTIWDVFETKIKSLIKILYNLFGKECPEEKAGSFMQFIKFCIVGASNAVVYYIVYAGSLFIFRYYGLMPEMDYQISQILGFGVSVFWAYNLNRVYVFSKSKNRYICGLLKFYATYAFTGLFMNSLLLYIWKTLGISAYIGPFINVIFTTPVNYVMAKVWAFRRKN